MIEIEGHILNNISSEELAKYIGVTKETEKLYYMCNMCGLLFYFPNKEEGLIISYSNEYKFNGFMRSKFSDLNCKEIILKLTLL